MGTVYSAAATRTDSVAAALPGVWRANELASFKAITMATGHALLDRELPDGGWPTGALIELLVQQPGIGEMQLLRHALHRSAKQAIGLIHPPHLPQAAAWAADGFPVQRLVWVKTKRSADALWAAEQMLRNGSCGALVLWQTQIRSESVRRLHLAAQAADTAFWLIRPLAAAQSASPAPLRLALRPAAGGISIEIVKRRGPHRDGSLLVPLDQRSALHSTVIEPHYALVDKRAPATAAAGNVSSALV